MIDEPLLRLAVFDCDGTIVDSEKSIVDCMHAAFAIHGFAPPMAEDVRRMVGLPLLDAVARLVPDARTDTHEHLRTAYIDAFAGLRRSGSVHEPLYAGAVDALDAFDAAGYLLGVATGKAHKGLVNTLATHGLQDRFVTLQTADRARGKPHPEMLLNAMNETGARVCDTVMIGDTTYDMEMARNAGTLAIGVAWGYHERKDLEAAGAHVVVDAYTELFSVVDAALGAS